MAQASAGAIDLYFLDECGFAPTLPTTYTWARVGVRVSVPYVAPQGRRVNVIGALAPYGPQPRLAYHSRCGKIDSAAFVEFLWRDVARLPAPPRDLPATYRRERPCVIVLDNYSVHRSAVVKDLLPALQAAGVSIFYLPPYSPELNAIERRPSYDRGNADQPQEAGEYHGDTPRPSPRRLHATGGPALPPCGGAAMGDRVAGWEPAVHPGLLVRPAVRAPGEGECSGGHDHDGWLTSVRPRRHPFESEGAA